MDETEKAQAEQLKADPAEGGAVMSAEVPRVLTDRDLVRSSVMRALSPRSKATLTATTGHYRLDDITGGLQKEFVWVIGADTSWGKTSLVIMMADENMALGKRFLIVSAEDPERIYGDRFVVRRANVSADRYAKQRLTRDERDRVEAVKGKEEPVYLDARGRGVEWVCRHVKRLIKEYAIDVVAYDYLQAFDNEKPQQDRRNQVTYIARVLTDSVKTSGAAGIILSQITVQPGKPHPDKHSIRESRDVSNAAEVVMLGFTPDKMIERTVGEKKELLALAGDRCLFVDKCKNGPRGGLIVMPWNNDGAFFEKEVHPRQAEEDAQAKQYEEEFGDFGDSVPRHWSEEAYP